jgi:phage-related protein
MRRSATLTLLFSALLSLAGCKTPCRQLSEELCNCVPQFQRTDCVRLAAERERSVEPTDQEQNFCEQKLDSCKLQKVEDSNLPLSSDEKLSCADLQDEKGKEDCGLTR